LRLDLLAEADLALVDPQGEATIRIGAGPCLENHRRTFLPVIGERDEHPVATFQAFGKLHQPLLTPSRPHSVRWSQDGENSRTNSRKARACGTPCRVPPRGIEPLPQAPEACVISISPRGQAHRDRRAVAITAPRRPSTGGRPGGSRAARGDPAT